MLAGWVRSQGLRPLPRYRACCWAHHLSQLEHLVACSQGVGPQPGVSSPRLPGPSPPAGGRYIKMFREKHMPTAKGPLQNSVQPWQGRMLGENKEEGDLADSGRLFMHNMPYTSTEEDLEVLFSPYGRSLLLTVHVGPCCVWLPLGCDGPVCLPLALDLG